MIKLIHMATMLALLIFSSHAMAYDTPSHSMDHMHTLHVEHTDKGASEPCCNSHLGMPICIICLAAGAFTTIDNPVSQQKSAMAPLISISLTGKSLSPPVPPPRQMA